jgi:hypothetical protein
VSFYVEVDPAALADYQRLGPDERRAVREKLGALVLSGIPEDAEIVVGKRMPTA